MKAGRNNFCHKKSVVVLESRGSIVTKAAFLLFLLWYSKTKVKQKNLFAMEKGRSAFPAAPVSSITHLPKQDVFHAIEEVACWKHNEPSMNPNCTSLAPALHCGTGWEEMLARGNATGSFCTHSYSLPLRKQRQRAAMERYIDLPFYYQPCVLLFTFQPLTGWIMLLSVGSQVWGM